MVAPNGFNESLLAKSAIMPKMNSSLPQPSTASLNRPKKSFDIFNSNYSFLSGPSQFISHNQRDQLQVKQNLLNITQINTTPNSTNLTESLLNINESTFYSNIMYEKFIFYAVMCLITLNMTTEFILLMLKSIKKKKEKCCCKACGCKDSKGKLYGNEANTDELELDHDLVAASSHKYLFGKCENELLYTKSMYFSNTSRKTFSFVKYYFEKIVYENRKNFRYSKQFINTHIIAFVLLYYISSIIIRKSNKIVNLSSNFLILLINFIFKMNPTSEFSVNSNMQIKLLIESLYDNINLYITLACLFTTGIFVTQLLLGIKNYHKNVLNAYRGVYLDIPPPGSFSNTKLMSSSLHYRYVF